MTLRRAMRLAAVAAALLASAGCSRLIVLHDPLDPVERLDLGVAYERQGRDDLAAQQYRRVLRRDRSMWRAHFNLGNVAARAGRWSEAERRYRDALERAPGEADVMNNLAVALSARGRRDEALQWARRAVGHGGDRDSVYRATLAEIDAKP
jgi:Flp pilus assembly protein TadD